MPAIEPTLEALRAATRGLGPADDLARYTHDESGLAASGAPALVLRPGSTEEVAAIVRACRREGRQLTIQGGRTGLAGGAVPDPGDVVLSLERLNRVEQVDPMGGTVVAQAGVVLATLCAHVEEAGWYFPMDSGARASCLVGGAIATNMGGNRVLRYGTMRELVLGLEAVLADGTVLTMMNRGLKNNTGLDLKHLFIGTEGTLGIVTRAVLRLFPRPMRRDSALVALTSMDELPALLKEARAALPTLSSFEVMWRDYLQAAAQVTGLQEPFDGAHPLCVLLEVETCHAGDDERDALHAFLAARIEDGRVPDTILPQSGEQAAQLWRLRDAIGEILPRMAPSVAFDIGIPLPLLPRFIAQVGHTLQTRWPHARRLFFGHLGDGNLHLSTGPFATGDLSAVESCVYEEVEHAGGSISAEHGIGRIKKPFLHHSRSPAERALMRQVRSLLDPDARLNRGRILDP